VELTAEYAKSRLAVSAVPIGFVYPRR